MVIGLSGVQFREYNQASYFKLAEHVVWGWFEIMSMITPELYDTKSSYQLIVSITKCEIRKSMCPSGIYFLLSVLQAAEKQL